MVTVMNISFEYYRVFYYVALCGNITQAAALLYVNQPNLTRTIHLLEQALGCPLFLRSNRGVTLTPEGELLFSHVAPAVEHIESAQRELTAQAEMRQGSVSIAASEVALRCLLLPVLNRFRGAYPQIRIQVSNHSTPQAISALREGLADLAVVTTPMETAKDMEQVCLTEFQEVPVCGKGGVSPPQQITPQELARHPLISLGRGTMTYRFYQQWFSENGLSFHPDIEAATADQILPMVKNQLGIGFVPEEFLAQETGAELQALSLTVPIPRRQICLVKKAQRPLSIAAQKLEQLLLENRIPKI